MKEFLRNIKFVWGYARNEKLRIGIYCLLSIFNIVASIVFPILSARMIVDLTDNNLEQFVFMGAVILLSTLITDTIQF